jgi:hypothetical protein
VPGSVVGPGSAGTEPALLDGAEVGTDGSLVAVADDAVTVGVTDVVTDVVPGSVSVGGRGRSRAPGGADDGDGLPDDGDVDVPTDACPLWTSLRSEAFSDTRTGGSEGLPVIRTLTNVGREVACSGGCSACGSSIRPLRSTSANAPPTANNGSTTTAPKHPRPLRGSSR